MKRFIFLLLCLLFTAQTLADVCMPASLDKIFVNAEYKGGIYCHDDNFTHKIIKKATDTTNAEYLYFCLMDAYSNSNLESKIKEKQEIETICTQTSTECDNVMLYIESKPVNKEQSFYKVKLANSNKIVWILVDSSKKETNSERNVENIFKLATKGYGYGYTDELDINLRYKNMQIFTDEALTKTISAKEIYSIPENIRNQIKSDLPTYQSDLYITIPNNSKNQKGSILFWSSLAKEKNKPVEVTLSDLKEKLIPSEYIEVYKRSNYQEWALKVLRKKGDRYLVSYTTSPENDVDLPSISSGEHHIAYPDVLYSWIQMKNVKFRLQEPKNNSIDKSPLFLREFVSVYKRKKDNDEFEEVPIIKKIKEKSYIKLKVILKMVDPLKINEQNELISKSYHLRDLLIPIYDEKNRINFWLTVLPYDDTCEVN